MKRIVLLIVCCLTMLLFIAACRTTYISKDSYFQGEVSVEYYQNTAPSQDDFVTLTFNDEGNYRVIFSFTPERTQSSSLPENLDIMIDDVPREIIVRQKALPNYLRITIEKNGRSEYHDFS